MIVSCRLNIFKLHSILSASQHVQLFNIKLYVTYIPCASANNVTVIYRKPEIHPIFFSVVKYFYTKM